MFPSASRSFRAVFRTRSGRAASGFIGGGQAGYNWQSGAFVFGLETDFDGTTASKSFNAIGNPFGPGTIITTSGGSIVSLSGDFLNVNASARLRLARHDPRPYRLRRHAGQSPDVLWDGRYRLWRRKRSSEHFRQHVGLVLAAASQVHRGSAGRSARALSTPSPTTSRSRANICTITSAAAIST